MNTEEAKIEYADIIWMPHHQSLTRRHMSLDERAAQFAPFAALTGYDDMVTEEARLTDSEIELSDNEIEILNAVIGEIAVMTSNGAHPVVGLTYFKPDALKSGGSYIDLTATVKKVDAVTKKLILYGSEDVENKQIPPIEIPIGRIIYIHVETSD